MSTTAGQIARRRAIGALSATLLIGLFVSGSARALAPAASARSDEVTRIVVRVVSRGAKAIGTGVGGARIQVLDLASGAVLATAVQEGSTGHTGEIMETAHRVGEAIYSTRPSASVEISLSLDGPRQVEIVAEAPLGNGQAMQRATKTLWLFPGKHLLGEGVVVELSGLNVDFQSPRPETSVGPADTLEVRARVRML